MDIKTSCQSTASTYTLCIQQYAADPLYIYPIATSKTQTLAQALWLSGKLAPRPLCSGIGRCGLCKVRFISSPPMATETERTFFDSWDIEQGWRLACRHALQELFAQTDYIELSLPEEALKPPPLLEENSLDVATMQKTHSVKLAVDLGTTSLHWVCSDATGKVIHQGQSLNPQMGAGADIISRLSFGMHEQGKALLAERVYESIKKILYSLPPQHNVEEICLAANTALTTLFLKKDCSTLAHAPYSLPLKGHSTEYIQGLPPLYIPPQLAPFVGGDISAGYAFFLAEESLTQEQRFPFLLADLGTNGEFILALSAEEALITSVPMGPALEGIGLQHGHMVDGSPGIVHTVQLGATGLVPHTIQNDPAQKICGTGYISLVHALLKVGIISAEGLFASSESISRSPFFKKILRHLDIKDGERILHLWPAQTPHSMTLRATDVEEILKVKAAFSLAMSHLLTHAGLAPSALKHIYLAGAMGMHIQKEDLEGLGFVPQGAGARICPLGNTALQGAQRLLYDSTLRQKLYAWSKTCTLVQLTENKHFTEKFMQHMNFSYAG